MVRVTLLTLCLLVVTVADCQARDRTAVRDVLEAALHAHPHGTIRCRAGDCHAHYARRDGRVCRGYFTVTRNVDGPTLSGPGIEASGWTSVVQYFERCHYRGPYRR